MLHAKASTASQLTHVHAQGHVALTATPGEMVAQWTTRDQGTPLVRWGLSPGNYTGSAKVRPLLARIAGGVAAYGLQCCHCRCLPRPPPGNRQSQNRHSLAAP